MSVSILILTLNEDANLPECLGLVKWSDDIVVLDSFSSDRTVKIAEEIGARAFSLQIQPPAWNDPPSR